MLRKLINYDLKWSMKVIVIFLSIGMGFAILGRLFSLMPDSIIFNIFNYICNGAALSLLINGVINAIIRGWVRFILVLYKDESYLTHTLPINKNTLYLSKVLSVIISVTISCLVLFLGLIVIYYSKDTINMLKESFKYISSTFDSSIFGLLLVVGLVLILEIIFIIFCGYFGIVCGYSYNQRKLLKSILFGLAAYLAFNMFTLIILVMATLFNKGLNGIVFGGSAQLEYKLIVTLMWFAVFIYTAYNLILYYVTNKFFNKGVNVD